MFLKLIKNWRAILSGYSRLAMYVLFNKDNKIASRAISRLGKCKECPLYNNGFCDNQKTVKNWTPYGWKEVRGCGCFLWAKIFTELTDRNQCPRNAWYE